MVKNIFWGSWSYFSFLSHQNQKWQRKTKVRENVSCFPTQFFVIFGCGVNFFKAYFSDFETVSMTYGKWCDIKYQEILDILYHTIFLTIIKTLVISTQYQHFIPKELRSKIKDWKCILDSFFYIFRKLKHFYWNLSVFQIFTPFWRKKYFFYFAFRFSTWKTDKVSKCLQKWKFQDLYISFYTPSGCVGLKMSFLWLFTIFQNCGLTPQNHVLFYKMYLNGQFYIDNALKFEPFCFSILKTKFFK